MRARQQRREKSSRARSTGPSRRDQDLARRTTVLANDTAAARLAIEALALKPQQ
jgi:hypothetical protein